MSLQKSFSLLIDINLCYKLFSLPFHSLIKLEWDGKRKREWYRKEMLCSLFLRLVIYIDKDYPMSFFKAIYFIWREFIWSFLFFSVFTVKSAFNNIKVIIQSSSSNVPWTKSGENRLHFSAFRRLSSVKGYRLLRLSSSSPTLAHTQTFHW